jgi:pimeloyl-ACP methyl ester carboxylesterase
MAFAVYSAPADFARPGNAYDAALKHKSVCIVTSDTRYANVAIYRPPVFLIHGIWSGKDAWNNFNALISDSGRFDTFRADYSPTAGDSVSSNEPSVLVQLAGAIWIYGLTNQIAVIQADAVTHSMGGLIARDMMLDPTFLSSDNRLQGLIHKLITIDTPHGGSQFATRLDNAPLACKEVFAAGSHPVAGAVADLEPGSALLNSLNSSQLTPQYSHAIVGTASSGEQSASLSFWTNSGLNWKGALVDVVCQTVILGGYQSVFNGDGNDLIVSESSQQYGFTAVGTTQSPNTIHAIDPDLFPLGPDALDQVISNGNKVASSTLTNSTTVVGLLNTFITDSSFVSVKP